MRSFLIATSVNAKSSYDNATSGQVGIYAYSSGRLKNIGDLGDINEVKTKELQLILHRSAEDGGNVVLPIYPNNLSYSVMGFEDATKFSALFTVPAPTYIGDYSIMIIKKGVGFNERNKWTATVHVSDTSITAEQLSELLVKAINSNSEASGVTAEYVDEDDTTGIAITSDSFDDYEIKGADKLFGVEALVNTAGFKGLLTTTHVKDLLDKAAADAGYEYTYTDGLDKLYPGYFGTNGNIPEIGQLVTIRFAEPRQVRTVDHEINQIIQIALVNNFEYLTALLDGLIKKFSNIAMPE